MGMTLGMGALVSLHRSVWISLLVVLVVWAFSVMPLLVPKDSRHPDRPLAFALAPGDRRLTAVFRSGISGTE